MVDYDCEGPGLAVPTAHTDNLYQYSDAAGDSGAKREWTFHIQAGPGGPGVAQVEPTRGSCSLDYPG